jgi:hypothetical protein
MKSRKKYVCLATMLIIFCAVIMPVKATIYGYWDFWPEEVLGSWSEGYLEATEEEIGDEHYCKIEWCFDGVMQDGDDYKIDIDYNGVSPGYPWNYESMKLEYRWGYGDWEQINGLFNYLPYDHEVLIDDPTDTTLYLRLYDCDREDDDIQHTWSFGVEPHLLVYDY